MTTIMPAGVAAARDLVGPAIAALVDRLAPDVRVVAAYHLGLADASGRPLAPGEGGSGKALRPALALLSARAAGAAPEQGVAPAVAVELVHNFSLLHDDIMDGDTERRHRPTAWTVFGIGAAILAGDALLALAQDALLEEPVPRSPWAARCLSAAVQRLIAGQAADLAFERRDDVTLAECLEMAGDKTAALMACACSIGVIHVGAPAGLAMGLAGDSQPGRELREILASSGQLSEADLLRAASLVQEAGGKQWAESEADTQLALAAECLAEADMPDEVRSEFAAIADFITARQC